MIGSLGMHAGHLAHRCVYMKTDIPIAGCAHAGRPVRLRPGHFGAQHRLPGPRTRQPLRRRHQLFPEHQRGQPGPHRDGQRRPGRRPPASTARRAALVPEELKVTDTRRTRSSSSARVSPGLLREGAGQARHPGGGDRPEQLPPVPAAVVPGRHRRAPRRRHRPVTARHLRQGPLGLRQDRRGSVGGPATHRSPPPTGRATRERCWCSPRARSLTSSAPPVPPSTTSRSTRWPGRCGCASIPSPCSTR